jgi:hypothetical protein
MTRVNSATTNENQTNNTFDPKALGPTGRRNGPLQNPQEIEVGFYKENKRLGGITRTTPKNPSIDLFQDVESEASAPQFGNGPAI